MSLVIPKQNEMPALESYKTALAEGRNEYEAPKMKTVMGVRVFASGEWTDSSGITRKWSDEDLDMLVAAFNAGVPAIVPLKAGHTPDSFNEEIAKELGVPVSVVTGDMGSGQITLGRMIRLERRGGLLMADFERVPESIAKLIEGGMFNTVSVEIEEKVGEFGPVMTGVAMLGAEEPAVDIASLDRAVVFGGKREGAAVISFALTEKSKQKLHQDFEALKAKTSDITKGMRSAPRFRALFEQLGQMFKDLVGGKHSSYDDIPIISLEDFESMPPEIIDLATNEYGGNVQALIDWAKGLPTFDACVAALTGKEGITDPAKVCGWLKSQGHKKEATDMEATTKGIQLKDFMAKFQINPDELIAIATQAGLDETATLAELLEVLKAAPPAGEPPAEEMAQFTKKFDAQAKEIKELRHESLVHSYQKATSELTHIPGKPEEVAETLAKLHETAGKETAEGVLKTYQDANGIAVAATRAVGTTKSGQKALDFDAAVTEYSKSHPEDARAVCVKAVMSGQPDLYREYVKEQRQK